MASIVIMNPTTVARLVGVMLFLVAGAIGQQQVWPSPEQSNRPNIILLMTDDQDLHMGSLDYMPYLQKHLINQGTTFENHYCTIAVCCPSRVSFLTGKAAHNTNVTDLTPPYGGYPKFLVEGLNENYLPIWLQSAGYNTYYVGKLMNSHTIYNYHSPYPAGWNGSDFLLDPYTYSYLDSYFQKNKEPPKSYKGQYQTDIVANKSFDFLDEAVKASDPFFLGIMPTAPHNNFEMASKFEISPPIAAKRHVGLFKDVRIPRTPSFNPSKPHGVSWIGTLPEHSSENIELNDEMYRQRLRALQAVDEMVDELVSRLSSYGILDNTYIIYTTDNGFHIGQHRLPPGKMCAFEEDVHIPFIVRGPGILRNNTVNMVTSHTDIAPTILHLAGAALREDFDGVVMPLTEAEAERQIKMLGEDGRKRHETVNIEYWGGALNEGDYGPRSYANNTYKALRIIGDEYNFLYTVWCNNEHELYDLLSDPYQTENIYSTDRILFSFHLSKITSRLDALLLVLKSCKGRTCTRPWDLLHKGGPVQSLRDAMSEEYDEFYEEQQVKVMFSKCERGYIISAEGPQTPLIYHGDGIWASHSEL